MTIILNFQSIALVVGWTALGFIVACVLGLLGLWATNSWLKIATCFRNLLSAIWFLMPIYIAILVIEMAIHGLGFGYHPDWYEHGKVGCLTLVLGGLIMLLCVPYGLTVVKTRQDEEEKDN